METVLGITSNGPFVQYTKSIVISCLEVDVKSVRLLLHAHPQYCLTWSKCKEGKKVR